MQDRVPIAEQIAEIETQVRALEKFPGRMRPETVARKTRALAAAARSLAWLAANEGWIRPIHAQRRALAAEVERAAVLDTGAARALFHAFPDAELTGIGPVPPPSAADAPGGDDQHDDALQREDA